MNRTEHLQPLYCPACGKEFLIVYRSKKGAVCNECRTRLKPLLLPACVARRRIVEAKTKTAARNGNSESGQRQQINFSIPQTGRNVNDSLEKQHL